MPKKGALYFKLYYKRYNKAKPRAKGNNLAIEEDVPSVDSDLAIVAKQFNKLSLEEELEYLAFFKTCLIQRDKKILKIKMQQSIALRDKVIRKRETKFAESFPFYFLSPDLVMIFRPVCFSTTLQLNVMS